MSDHTTIIIPGEPRYVPEEAAVAAAVRRLRELIPEADDIHHETAEHVVFRDCGGNFELIRCPACRQEIDVGRWQDWMDRDYSESGGFSLQPISVPCCNRSLTLDELAYEWPQGFSRFALLARNPGKQLSPAARAELETVLGCKLRVIHQHY
jgi:hypothetical protein